MNRIDEIKARYKVVTPETLRKSGRREVAFESVSRVYDRLGVYDNDISQMKRGIALALDIYYLVSENERLVEIEKSYEKWFDSNAGILASHNIGGFSFEENNK